MPDNFLEWRAIDSIEVEDYVGDVFNLETEHEEFIAEGIVVHNCPHWFDYTVPKLPPDGCQDLWKPGQIRLPGKPGQIPEPRIQLPGEPGEPITVAPVATAKDAEAWAAKTFEPASEAALPSYARPATRAELNKVAQDFGNIPPELRKFVDPDRPLRVAVMDEIGVSARAQPGFIQLHISDVSPGSSHFVTDHELRHAMINNQVINKHILKTGTTPRAMWTELDRRQIPKPIHANAAARRGSELHGVDEFIAQVGDSYESGLSADEHVARLTGSRGSKWGMDVESVSGANEVSYGNSRFWVQQEAEGAVSLWREWNEIT